MIGGRCLPYGDGITFWPVAELVQGRLRDRRRRRARGRREKIAARARRRRRRRRDRGRRGGGVRVRRPRRRRCRRPSGRFAGSSRCFSAIGRSSSCSTTSSGPSRRSWISSSTSPAGVATRGSCCCASRAPRSWIFGPGGRRANRAPRRSRSRRSPRPRASELIADLLGSLAARSLRTRRGSSTRPRGTRCSSRRCSGCSRTTDCSAASDDGWRVDGDLSRVAVPATIQALLAARLDRLGPDEQAVLGTAAVIGKEFWWGAVADLSPEGERPSVGSRLQTLVRKGLIAAGRSTLAGEDAFRFHHILIQDASYQAIPKERRAELHARFAGWIERRAGDRTRRVRRGDRVPPRAGVPVSDRARPHRRRHRSCRRARGRAALASRAAGARAGRRGRGRLAARAGLRRCTGRTYGRGPRSCPISARR